MKLEDLKPEAEWFRPPNHFEIARIGDVRSFMWVAEPSIHEGVYGVAYRVSAILDRCYKEHNVLELLKQAAKAELYRRIEIEEKRGEGELFDSFLWVPIISRSVDGSILIGSFDTVDIQISPSGVILSRNANLDTRNLYSRPGRFIPIDGPSPEMFEQIEIPFSESTRPEPEESPNAVTEAVRDTVERKNDGDDQLGPGRRA